MAVNRVALITGASRGVGAAVARALATERNMRIVVNFRNDRAAVDRLLEELAKLKPQHDDQSERPFVTAIQADMASPTDVARLVQETVERMGRLDIVVSNVGWTRMTNFMNLDDADAEEDWDRCFEVNVKSHFRLFRACQVHLESSEGAFIATASVAGVKPSGSSLVSVLLISVRRQRFARRKKNNRNLAIRCNQSSAHSPGKEPGSNCCAQDPRQFGSSRGPYDGELVAFWPCFLFFF